MRTLELYEAANSFLRGALAKMDSEELQGEDLKRMKGARRCMDEMHLSAAVDNFQTYLSDVTLYIFNERPEVLFGGKTSNSTIFESPDLDTLKRQVVDRHVLNLGYKSISDVDEYFSKNLGFTITTSKISALRLGRIVQIRNIIAHNRGRVNSLFMSKAGSKADKRDKLVTLPGLRQTNTYLQRLAQDVDGRAIAKFGLSEAIATVEDMKAASRGEQVRE